MALPQVKIEATNRFCFQAPSRYLRKYPSFRHEDGLETAILGLEFEVTSASFAPPSSSLLSSSSSSSSSSYLSSSSDLSLSLRCSSSVATVNSEAQTTEEHHQKSSVHFSYGSLFRTSSGEM